MQTERIVGEIVRTPERREVVAGVAVFAVTPDGCFYAVRERRTKRKTLKIKGMLSAPFETVEAGETYEQAVARTFKEEIVTGLPTPQLGPRLCSMCFSEGVWLHAYLIEVDARFNATTGLGGEDIEPYGWVHSSLVENAPRGLFRPGNREIVASFRAYQQEGENFKPRVYFTTSDYITEEEYCSAEGRC